MKFLVLLALVSLACSAPQPRKVFHENLEDFMDLIGDQAGDEIVHILSHYIEYEEFQQTLAFMETDKFKNLIYEMEDLPEFKDMVDFLEGHGIDISYDIDRFNEFYLQYSDADFDKIRSSRHEISGRDFNSYLQDIVAVFPKTELKALYEQKLAEDDEFRAAIESLQSDEWTQIYDAVWANEVFQDEVKTLSENGVDVNVLLDLLVATFGQN